MRKIRKINIWSNSKFNESVQCPSPYSDSIKTRQKIGCWRLKVAKFSKNIYIQFPPRKNLCRHAWPDNVLSFLIYTWTRIFQTLQRTTKWGAKVNLVNPSKANYSNLSMLREPREPSSSSPLHRNSVDMAIPKVHTLQKVILPNSNSIFIFKA